MGWYGMVCIGMVWNSNSTSRNNRSYRLGSFWLTGLQGILWHPFASSGLRDRLGVLSATPFERHSLIVRAIHGRTENSIFWLFG